MKYLSRSLGMKMRKIFSKNSFFNNLSLLKESNYVIHHLFQLQTYLWSQSYHHIRMDDGGGRVGEDQHHQIYRVRAILASTPPELTIDNSQCFSLNPNTWSVKYLFFNPTKHFYHCLDKGVKSQHLYRHNLQVSTQ